MVKKLFKHEFKAWLRIAPIIFGITLAIAAMEKLQKHNPAPDSATDDMVTLAVLNSSSVNLLPTTLIALRRAGGSAHAAAVLFPIWLVSAVSAVAAVLAARLLRHAYPIKRKDE